MDVRSIRTDGLGDSTYLFHHEGIGVLVDPQRDFERFLDGDVDVRYVLETHVHNDYVSGGLAVSQAVGAELVMPAGSGAAYRFTPAFHLEDIDVGPFVLRPLHTPGHTPEHVSYLVLVDGVATAVFSGGSLLVGSVGRSDLLGEDRASQLARLQHGSVMRLAELDDAVGLYPTHGSGSFCTATAAVSTTSTIGAERESNPALGFADAEAFATAQLSGLQPYPTYYAHMGPANIAGAEPAPSEPLREMTPDEVLAAQDEGIVVVDTRYKTAFADGHIPGSWGIELGNDFVAWVGWLIDYDSPLVLVADDEESVSEARTGLARIGFDHVVGWLRGVDAWAGAGMPLRSHATIGARAFVDAVTDPQLLDVRAPDEWEDGHVEGSIHCYLPDLMVRIPPELSKDEPVYIGCATGHRASTAAGILGEAGYEPIVMTGASLLGVVMLTAASV